MLVFIHFPLVAVPLLLPAIRDEHDGGENVMAELWAPEWSTPWALPDVEQLHGRAGGSGATTKQCPVLDMARAIASLSVDCGIVAFQRHVFAERLGQSPLAVPADRLVVFERGGVGLLGGLDPWLDQLWRVDTGGVGAARLSRPSTRMRSAARPPRWSRCSRRWVAVMRRWRGRGRRERRWGRWCCGPGNGYSLSCSRPCTWIPSCGWRSCSPPPTTPARRRRWVGCGRCYPRVAAAGRRVVWTECGVPVSLAAG